MDSREQPSFAKQNLLKTLLTILLVASATHLNFPVSAQNKPCQPKRHAKLPVITDLTYHRARKKLLAAGWQPVRTKSLFANIEDDPDIGYGNGRIFWERGYLEVEACSGTGLAPCAFLFKDAYGNRLRVVTEGEELPKDKIYARISGYSFDCEK